VDARQKPRLPRWGHPLGPLAGARNTSWQALPPRGWPHLGRGSGGRATLGWALKTRSIKYLYSTPCRVITEVQGEVPARLAPGTGGGNWDTYK
jgi:hypothetical protein